MIARDEYIDFLIRSKDKPVIKVISGIRRCGKSTLFELFKECLLRDGTEENQIISINFEDMDYEELLNYRRLHKYVTDRLLPDKMNYIFLDEIQHVPSFERAVDSLFIKKNTDIYITGSNAYFMSGELATLLSGRYIELRMLPLSFSEYCAGNTADISVSEKYRQYIESSSFPYVLGFGGNRKEINDYLQGIYNTVLLKDIVARYNIADVMMLESVVKFVFDNIGNQLSITKIANTMTSAGRKINPKTIEKYLLGLLDSMMI